MTDRNEPCPCGSGRKYKRCCIDKPVDYGQCAACADLAGEIPDELGQLVEKEITKAIGKQFCKLCGKEYPFCRRHQEDMQIAMRGHVMRVHPESIPGVIDRLSVRDMTMIQEQYELEPELWRKLVEFIDGRRRGKN